MTFDENTPYLGEDFEGDTVTLVSNVGGRRDRHFSRNYAWAKHAADQGKLKTIVVNVVANGEAYRTVDAFKRSIGNAPHKAVRVSVTHTRKVEDATAIVDAITALVKPHTEQAPKAAQEKPQPAKRPAVAEAPAPDEELGEFDAEKAEHVAAVTS